MFFLKVKASTTPKLTVAQKEKLCDYCDKCHNCGFCAGGYTETCENLKQFAIANRIPLITF